MNRRVGITWSEKAALAASLLEHVHAHAHTWGWRFAADVLERFYGR